VFAGALPCERACCQPHLHCTARRCEIHIFDPTLTDEQNKLMKSLPGITFHAYGLGAMDGEVRGAARRQGSPAGDRGMLCLQTSQTREQRVLVAGGNLSAFGAQVPVLTLHDTMGRNRSAMAVRRLNTIMRGLGHEWLDMLKVDVEGAEWAAFEDLLTEEKHQLLPFTQLQARRPGRRSHPCSWRRPAWRRRCTGCGPPRSCRRAGRAAAHALLVPLVAHSPMSA